MTLDFVPQVRGAVKDFQPRGDLIIFELEKRPVDTHVRSSVVHNSQNMEATLVSTDGHRNDPDVVNIVEYH